MKKLFFLSLMFGILISANGQFKDKKFIFNSNKLSNVSLPEEGNSGNQISQFAISVNPLGFLQFGPMVNAEIGLTDNIVFNAHLRFPALGLLSYAVMSSDEDDIDELKGSALGGGVIYFAGERKSKPYIGLMIDYNKLEAVYDRGKDGEWWQTSNAIVIIFNAGYRFRFDGGFFINTGGYLGAYSSKWEWDYANPFCDEALYDTDERSGNSMEPFGMAEVSVGIEF